MELRLPIRFMSYHKRCFGLNGLELKTIHQTKMVVAALVFSLQHERNQINRNQFKIRRLSAALERCLQFYSGIILMPKIPRTVRAHHEPRTINSFSAAECWRQFRFRKRDLLRLKRCLLIGNEIKIRRHKFTGEEILLYSLHRLASTTTHSDLAHIYGRDYTAWSVCYGWFLQHVLNNFSDLLTDNLEFWSAYFPSCSEAIRTKMLEKTGVHFEQFFVCGFHDCTVIGCSRPGGGPAEPGENAARYNNYIQMAFYNGWKHMHGTKWLTMELPNGMCAFMYGPYSFRCKIVCLKNVLSFMMIVLPHLGAATLKC